MTVFARGGRFGRLIVTMSLVAAATVVVPGVPGGVARADTDPPAGTPPTVSVDPLPTWQVNGVVWSQVVVGNTVYATGSFTKARPPGTSTGSPQEVNRGNLLAYDITTGNLITSFSHSLNAQGLRVVASPDGSRVYVGGDFTTVDGVARNHLAAFDTATGALVTGFAPSVSARVRAIAATNSTVYFGGNFFNVGGSARTRLAAVTAATGANISTWRPTADDDEVFAMALSPDGTRVVIGGRFQMLNGAAHVGVGAVNASTGVSVTWNSTPVPARIGSSYSYPTDFQVAGTTLYASEDGEGGHWFDGRWAANVDTGDLIWLDNCYGATYSVAPVGQVLYSVSHAHDCTSLGAFPDVGGVWHRALAETTYPTGVDQTPPGSNSTISHQPVPSLLHWFPTLASGSYTGQYQAAWSVVGTADYVALGGEFPQVEGKAQQGLTRFAVKALAPKKIGPVSSGVSAPAATAVGGGKVRVAWQTTWDHDNVKLTYEVLRDGGSAPVYTTTADSTFWNLPSIGFFDAGLAPGSSHTYRVRVSDPAGNSVTSATSAPVTAGSGTASGYESAVVADGASDLWRLGEASGTTAYDHAGFNDLTTGPGVSRGAAGALDGDSDTASVFDGTDSGTAASKAAPTPGGFSVEAWVKTSSTSGGKIVGYGNQTTGGSSNYDRHLYLTNDGRVVFGVYPGGVRTLQSGTGFNDGQWHHVVGTLDAAAGMKLYVDGALIGGDAGTTSAQGYSGYWRVGGDNLNGWPSQPSSNDLSGAIDEVAVYPAALTAAQVAEHHGVGVGTVTPNQPPSAAFASSCTLLECTFDASGSADGDGSVSSYAWDFGDGSTGSGVNVSHTYAAAGDRAVTLTVTDNDGATDEVTHTVSPSAPPSPALAGDTFTRTVSGGFGTADTGGAWTTTGTAANLSVGGGAATIALPTVSAGPGAYLNGVSTTDADVAATVASDKVGTGNGVYFWLAGRRVAGAGEYRARIRLRPSGVVSLQVSRTDAANAETAIGAEQTVSGLTYAAGTVLRMRVQVVGASPTALQAKVWADGTAEPASWQVTGTDSTAGLQVAGSVGVRTYLSGSATNAPVTLTLDDFTAVRTNP
ncbi:LamG-like jellyroll fold domain-containing protein [Actinomadura scrupuli]|uniref:LamG-like jellyroll fold domain-containing protein n=1 Tax=Actinomadura scrupuli TaxID=559629 RepID=UPI003D993B8D